MIYYIYDGSFEGLLTAIYESYYKEEKPEEIFREQDFIPSFLIEPIYIKTDKEKADKVYNSIKNKISYEVLKNIFYVFLSELKECSTVIYKYLKMGFKIGKDIDLHMYNNTVLYIHNISRKVAGEAHRMLGFIRFKVLSNGLYYAEMEPDYNIIELIISHFAQRFSSERFIIHDRRRGIAALYDGNKWITTEMSIGDIDHILQNKSYDIYEKLWKEYFNSTAIDNRKNVKLQKRYMPERYWKFITEMI